MKSYKCNGCHTLLLEDEINKTEVSDPFATGDHWHVEEEWYCPDCGGDSIDEVFLCISCEKVETEDGLDECVPCFHKNGG